MLVALIVTTGAWAQFFAANGIKSLPAKRAGKAVVNKAPSSDNNWLYYDDGVYSAGVGTGGSDVYWGIMLPAESLTGNTLEKISVYEDSQYNIDPITVMIYSGGDTAPAGDPLYTETFTPVGGSAFHEVTLASPVTIDQTQNVWIILKEYGTYPAMGCVNTGDINGRWISLDGVQYEDVTTYGLDYTWMLRAYFSNTTASYELNVGTSEHGTIAFTVGGETATTAQEDDEVTVTITPDDGWITGTVEGKWYAAGAVKAPRSATDIELLEDIELTPVDGNENVYTFVMKRAHAELSVTYRKMLTNADITIDDIQAVTYNGQAQEPEVTVKDGSVELTRDQDYSVLYENNLNAGTATATIVGIGMYSGEVVKNFTIEKAAGVISFEESTVSKTYGDADFTNTLTNNGDGTVTYASDNESVATVNSETGLVTITGAPGEVTITATVTDGTNYTYATTTATFTIEVNTAAITVSAEGFTGTYDGDSHTITVTVTEPEGTTVKYGTTEGEYNLDEAPAYTDAGEYTIYYQVTKENYTTVENSAVVSIQKAEASISYETTAVTKTDEDEAFINELTMTGDGTVTYSSDNVEVATVNSETGEVTITGIGNATITATVDDGTNYTYATKTAQYTLTVEAATGISNVKTDAAENANWYDLSGRLMNGKPTKAGIYVKNGKKVVIK